MRGTAGCGTRSAPEWRERISVFEQGSVLERLERRLRILLAIGAVHAFLLWAGDILMLYALLGSTMPWFARKTDRELLRWCLLGWGVGRPANLIAARALGHWPYLPPSPGGLIGVLAQAVGVPMLAIGYAATVGPSDAGS